MSVQTNETVWRKLVQAYVTSAVKLYLDIETKVMPDNRAQETPTKTHSWLTTLGTNYGYCSYGCQCSPGCSCHAIGYKDSETFLGQLFLDLSQEVTKMSCVIWSLGMSTVF